MMILHLILHSTVHIYDFHIFKTSLLYPLQKPLFNSNFKLSPYTRILFLPLVKEQLSKLILFNVGKGVINNCQKLLLKGDLLSLKPKNGTLPGHKILSLAKVQRFVLFNESCKSKFLSRSDSFHVRGLSFLYTPLKSMDEMLLKKWQLIQLYWWFYKK